MQAGHSHLRSQLLRIPAIFVSIHNSVKEKYIQDAVPKPDDETKHLPVSTSVPPVFPPEQEQLFREVLTLFNEAQIPYAVSGAFALQKHTGIWRNTKDLDLFLAPEDVPAAMQALKDNEFETEVRDPVWLAKAHRSDFFVDLITGMSNAVITVNRSWIDRSTPAEIMGVPSRVLAPEELICSKLFVTFRERFDGADIVHVIHGTRGTLDWQRILGIVGEHWELLLWAMLFFHYVYPAETHYVPRVVWDDLLGRLHRELDSPRADAHFRGSLLDERMFAIDVHEWGMANLIEHHRSNREGKILEESANPRPPESLGTAEEPAA